ncbi:GMC oxidoreductase [Streptomyces sp. RKND-216]|uniref:GMC oxidoreductase n=1 Tax=Streptomyces sp. RKND-216 TaxID=2562581 RepID=UPI0024906AC5|nr:GMC oxidoreductase [Streptomyces sp. RKND-216]
MRRCTTSRSSPAALRTPCTPAPACSAAAPRTTRSSASGRCRRTCTSGSPGAAPAPGSERETERELSEYGRRAAHTVHHPAGTCRMGTSDDPLAVLAPLLRVRVVDASVFPTMPTGNPMVTVLLVAERAADLLTGAAPVEEERP